MLSRLLSGPRSSLTKVKLISDMGTGYQYIRMKSSKLKGEKIQKRLYDPIVAAHTSFSEVSMLKKPKKKVWPHKYVFKVTATRLRTAMKRIWSQY